MTEDLHNEMGELLSAYLDDELTPEERARVEARISTDADARALLAELRAAADAVRALPHDSAPPDVLDAISARLERDALLAGDDQDVTLARHRPSPMRATLAVAAMLAVVVGGGLYVSWQLSQDSREQPTLARSDSRNSDQSTLEKSTESAARELESDAFTRQKAAPPADEVSTALRSPRAGGRIASGSKELDDAAAKTDDDIVGQATEELLSATGMILKDERKAGDEIDSPEFAQRQEAGRPGQEQVGRDAGVAIDRSQSILVGGRGTAVSIADTAGAPPAAARTFEQRLAAGETWTALADHDFANEPLQLTVHFRGAMSPDQFADRVIERLTQRGAASIADLAAASTPAANPSARSSLVQRTIREASNPDAWLLYLESAPPANAAPDAPRRQVLARMPADWLVEIIDEAAAADAHSMALRLGQWTATNRADARNMAELALAAPPAPAPAAQPAESRDVAGWLGLFGRLALPGEAAWAEANLGYPVERPAESAPSTPAAANEGATSNGAPDDLASAVQLADTPSSGLAAAAPASTADVPRIPRTADHLVTVVIDLRADPPSAPAAEPQP